MAKIEQYSRIINHAISTSGKTFTVPSSNDHTDETWLATDLYIGEIGVNITDDKVYIRTNNGIVQLATGASASNGNSIFIWNPSTIEIGSTYSATAITPNGLYYTDLGSTSKRFKDVYIGGSGTNAAKVDVNGSLWLKEASNSILTTNGVAATNAPIDINYYSSNLNKDRAIHLNSRYTSFSGSTNHIVSIASHNVYGTDNAYCVSIGTKSLTFDEAVQEVVHIGHGFGRTDYNSNEVVVGGGLCVRSVYDDGSGQYDRADWSTYQANLRTTDALITNIASIPWVTPSEVVQVKAYVIGTDITDPTKVYSCEISGVYTKNSSNVVTEVGTPVILEWSTNNFTGEAPTVELGADVSYCSIKVKGSTSNTINWLCTYSYHKLVSIL